MKITEALLHNNITRHKKTMNKFIPTIGISFFVGFLSGILTLLWLLEKAK